MRPFLLCMLLALTASSLTGCLPAYPWSFGAIDPNDSANPPNVFSGSWRFYWDGTLTIENDRHEVMEGTYSDCGTTVTFAVEYTWSGTSNACQINEHYELSGRLSRIQGIDGVALDGPGIYSVHYSGPDPPGGVTFASGGCNVSGLLTVYDIQAELMTWLFGLFGTQ